MWGLKSVAWSVSSMVGSLEETMAVVLGSAMVDLMVYSMVVWLVE